MLAGRWGVDETTGGKRVWADLVDPRAGARGARSRSAPERTQDPSDGELPPGWALVRLVQCPVALSLRQDSHLDELVRELQLLGVDEHNSESAAIAEEIRGLLVSPTHARLTARRAAEQARDDHLDFVDIEMAMPREFGVLVEQLQRAVARADRLCEEGRMLTLASPAELRALRAWMAHEVLGQTSRGAAPMSWPAWLAATPAA